MVVMTNEKVRKLIRWDSSDPAAMLDQLQERVRTAMKAGKSYGVVVCCIERDDEAGKTTYDAGCSPLPVEVIVMAAEIIKDQAKYEWSKS
jgi:hypothetical protein